MAKLYFEDVKEGMEIPVLKKHPTTRQLVMWAGASGDFYEIHYDKDFAQGTGLPGVIVHGWLTFSFLNQMITDWIGEDGRIKKIGVSYRGMHFPCQELVCKGVVKRKYKENGENLVECEIWAENPKGEKTTPGTCIVALPSRET